jgi:hypothetical protein
MICPRHAGIFFRTAGCCHEDGQDEAIFDEMLSQAGSGI